MVQEEKNIILVVSGYGCHLDSPLGWTYLPKVQMFIKENKDFISAVIFCGGFTQRKTANGYSEACVMSSFLTQDIDDKPPKFILEENSYTTFYNICNASRIIASIPLECLLTGRINRKIIIFCEATGSANVMMLARHFMLKLVESIDDITVETASWERADPFKQAFNLIYNKAAIKYPRLCLAEREQMRRIRLSENR